MEVSDEGDYWETGNLEGLKAKMDLIHAKLDALAADLSDSRLGDLTGLSAEAIVLHIERMLGELREDSEASSRENQDARGT